MIRGSRRQSEMASALDCVTHSDTGRKRDHNEDRVTADPANGVVILADGMGGHKAGETASALAVETITQQLAEKLKTLPQDDDQDIHSPAAVVTRDAIVRANSIINETARLQPQYEGMGTTVVAAVFHDEQLAIAHVGDSRAYRLRSGKIEQITRDHSLMQELIDRGFYTPEEARESLNRNIVTRALGTEETVIVDLQEEIALPGDQYLLCSDGLSDMLDDETIRLTIEESDGNLESAANRLIDQANEQGGDDNISIALVRVNRALSGRRTWFRRLVDWFQ